MVETVEKAWFNNPKKTIEPYPECNWCDTELSNPDTLLVMLTQVGASSPMGWVCESCARERNLIW